MNLKSAILLILSFAMVCQLQAQKKFRIVTSASIMQDMAQNVAGDIQTIENIVPIGGDPHLHTPTPRDAKLVADADLIMINGLTFEGWITELIDNSGTNAKVVTITEGITPRTSQVYKNSSDPHCWMDASKGLVYIKNILDALIELDPANKEGYTRNYNSYRKEIIELDEYIEDKIREIPMEKRVLITSHDAFAYYGQRYSIQVEALMGISTEAEAQTSDMIRVNKTIRERKIPAIFVESTINPKLINQIAKDNDIKIGGELFADSIGNKESGADTYIKMLKQNTDVIVQALSGNNEIAITKDHNHHENNGSNNLLLYLLAGLLLVGGMVYVITRLNK